LSYGAIGNALSRAYPSRVDEAYPPNVFNRFLIIAEAALADRPRIILLPNPDIVFVVDDDPGILMSVKRLLRTNGYDSLLFSSAKAFNNQVDFNDACCVVLDINLEDGSGIDLRHRLKVDGRSLPVIYMTASDNPAVRKAALDSGCIAFLTKPFSVQELIEPLKKASAGRS